ncbi:sensor histidine kinase [Paenibacillus beijingensis]|uniref:histidine kinase n=1 Tax=Paenibacillus beijingensis TaxID=1126833 RepID=A0A0D5NQZ8_9BACL|nr:sensor histidine kinase [Paenibacillus beijingensis]AJY77333.1 hypothetical protein VN24_25695 [Paenibacillus beijingensis]
MVRKLQISGSFSSKIILAFLFVILLPTLFTSVSFYWESNSVLKKNVRESTVQITKQTAESLSFILNVGVDTSDFISNNLQIQQAVLHPKNVPAYEENSDDQYIDTLLNNFVFSNSFVKIVYVLKENGSGWSSGAFSNNKMKKIRLSDQEWVKETKRRDGELVWQPIQYDHFSGLVLPVGRVLKDFDTMRNIGLVQVDLDGRSVFKTIGQLKLGKTGKFFVVDSEGKIMIDSNLEMVNKRVDNSELYKHIVGNDAMEFEYEVNGVPYYGVKEPLSNGWMIVGTVPVHEISGQLNSLKSWILFSCAVFSMLAICIGLFIAGWVTKPVKQLTRSMMLVQKGDLKVRTTVQSSDEIGFLSKQFNKMVHEIGHLMRQVKNEQSEKHHAELRAVIHRVHPHFLYNTLSTLRWLIDSNQNDRASSVLTALNHLLEANMAKNGNMITVSEELDIIKKYLVILELRYEKTFDLKLDVEPGLEKIVIPRMLLQPVVENAIFHGIVPTNQDGRISIRVHSCNGDLEFHVYDNGMGIDEERLKQLNEPEAAIAAGEIGIGLRHIYDTLRLYYAGNWEWSVESKPGQGTAIHIVLKQLAKSVS